MPDKPQQKQRTNRVFKSLHKPLTYLGVNARCSTSFVLAQWGPSISSIPSSQVSPSS